MIHRHSSATLTKIPALSSRPVPALFWLILALGLAIGVVLAQLLVSGEWQLAAALVLLLPGLIILHKYPFMALIVWFALSPFLLHTTTGAERRVYWIIHRALPPLTVGIILLSTALRIRTRRLPKLGVPEMAIAAYLLFGVVSILLLSGTPLATLYHFYDRVFSPVCLYLIIRLTQPGEREWRLLLPLLCFIALSQVMIGVTSWVAPSALPSKWLDKLGQRTTGTLVNPSIYTTVLAFCGFMLLHGAWQLKNGLRRKAYLAAFLLCLFGFFISLSRAGWLAGMLSVAGLVIIYPRLMVRLGLVTLVLSLFLGSILFPPYVEQARQRLYSAESTGSALDRLPGYLAAYRMFQEKPLFGWGYGNFDVYDRQFMGRVLQFSNDNKDHASHNWYLSILAEQGLVGAGLFLGPLAWWLVMSLRQWSRLPRRGPWNRKLLLVLWLVVLFQVVTNNFINMLIFVGHSVWWIVLAMIANVVAGQRLPVPVDAWQQKVTAVWKSAPLQPF